MIPWQEPQDIFLNGELQKVSFPSSCPKVKKRREGNFLFFKHLLCRGGGEGFLLDEV